MVGLSPWKEEGKDSEGISGSGIAWRNQNYRLICSDVVVEGAKYTKWVGKLRVWSGGGSATGLLLQNLPPLSEKAMEAKQPPLALVRGVRLVR